MASLLLILRLILAELSIKIKMLAGTSPSPEPGGTGFASTLDINAISNKMNKNKKYFAKCFII